MIQVLQYRGTSMVSRAIKLFTWGIYSHTAILNTATGEIIEAWQGEGVRKVSLEFHRHTKGTRVDVFNIISMKADHAGIWQGMEKRVGRGYDYRGIFGFLSHSAAQDNKKDFCSEAAFSEIAANGCTLLNIESYKVSPSLIAISPLLQFERQIVLR
jgi:uncharacterized protein YycO